MDIISKTSLLLVLFVSQICVAQTKQITIDPTISFQEMQYFTASDAWSGGFVAKYWENTEKEQIAKWLFSQKTDEAGNPQGIGLSLWRVNLGAGTFEQDGADIQPIQRRAESFLTVDGKHYDWGKCTSQQYFMKKAVEYGCNNFLLFSNSPLVQYTLNGKGWSASDTTANIRPDCYGKYANYLATVAAHFIDMGWNISYISPINEPQIEWNTPRQEGSPWKNSQIKKMVTALDESMSTDKKFDNTHILVGESNEMPQLYANGGERSRFGKDNSETPDYQIRNLFERNSPYYIGNLKHVPSLIAAHSYGNHTTNKLLKETRAKVKEECEKYHLHFQESEWCMLPGMKLPMDGFTSDWKDENGGGIQEALLLGRLIYSDVVYAGSESWSYWKGMELNGSRSLIGLYAKDNNIFNGGTAATNKILWALGNYSFFVRPGYKRISLSGADDLNTLIGTAFIAPDHTKIVVVFTNSSFNKEQISIQLPKTFKRKGQKVTVYRTDERTDLAYILSGDLTSSYSVEPRSLTTFVIEKF